MANSAYDIDYFIEKFEAIPEEKWRDDGAYTGEDDRRCALGHCGILDPLDDLRGRGNEGRALARIFSAQGNNIVEVNDGRDSGLSYGATPRERVLNALRSFKEKEASCVSTP